MSVIKDLLFATMKANGEKQKGDFSGKHFEDITRKPVPPGGGGVTSWNDLTDKPFGEEEVIVLPETELTSAGGPSIFTPLTSIDGSGVYNVTFDGVVYECSPITPDGTSYLLGNGAAIGGADSGEPFAIMVGNQGGSLMGVFISLVGDITANVSIKGFISVPIEPKYIPTPEVVDLTALGISYIKTATTVDAVLGDDLKNALENQLHNMASRGIIKVKFDYYLEKPDGGYRQSSCALPMLISISGVEYHMNGICFGHLIEIIYANGTISATANRLAYEA